MSYYPLYSILLHLQIWSPVTSVVTTPTAYWIQDGPLLNFTHSSIQHLPVSSLSSPLPNHEERRDWTGLLALRYAFGKIWLKSYNLRFQLSRQYRQTAPMSSMGILRSQQTVVMRFCQLHFKTINCTNVESCHIVSVSSSLGVRPENGCFSVFFCIDISTFIPSQNHFYPLFRYWI